MLAALLVFAATPGDAFGQTLGPISASELDDWATAMNRFNFGERSCPALVTKVQNTIGSIVAAAAGGDSGWEWVADITGRKAGDTVIEYNRTGAVRPKATPDRPNPTHLSAAEIGSGSTGPNYSDYFLWGVAHEALHWVNPVGVDQNGEKDEDHLGPDWKDLAGRG